MKLTSLSHKVNSVCRSYTPSELLVMPDNMVGIEIEIEGVSTMDSVWTSNSEFTNYWEVVEDPSLRNGVELRFRGPLFGDDVIKALQAVDTLLKEVSFSTSLRTSTHVHFDLSAFETTKDLLKLLALAGIFEPALFKYVGQDRDKSIYCIPYLSSRGDFSAISSLIRKPELHDRSIGRYQAINLQSIFAHGTVEFRHAKAYTTYDGLLDWVNILGSIVKYASEGDFEVEDLATLCSSKHPVDFLEEVFPDHHEKLIYIGLQEDISRSVRAVDDMIHFQELRGLEAYRGIGEEDGGIVAKVFEEKLGLKGKKKKSSTGRVRGFDASVWNIPEPQIARQQVIVDGLDVDDEW